MTISIRNYGTWESEQPRKEEGGLDPVMMEELMDGVQVECLIDGTIVTMRKHLTTH